MGDVVINVYVKSNYDQMHIDKALGFWKSNYSKKHKNKKSTTFVVTGYPFQPPGPEIVTKFYN